MTNKHVKKIECYGCYMLPSNSIPNFMNHELITKLISRNFQHIHFANEDSTSLDYEKHPSDSRNGGSGD